MGPLEQAKSAIIRQFDALATTDLQASIVHLQTKVESDVDLFGVDERAVSLSAILFAFS